MNADMRRAVMGAGGTEQGDELFSVEVSSRGLENLRARGLTAVSQDQAIPHADVVILTVPDHLIGSISRSVVPMMRTGAKLILLDPAAAYLDQLPVRPDITFFITHPCHPPVFHDEVTPEAPADHFGGVAAKQSIVCTLMQGPEGDFSICEAIAKRMYKPVPRSHRISVEQMAMLEPAMAETVGGTLAMMYREAMDEAVRRGVPYEAARDFMLGHIRIELAIAFEEVGSPFSDAALVAIEWAKQRIVKPDWKRVFDTDELRDNIATMISSR